MTGTLAFLVLLFCILVSILVPFVVSPDFVAQYGAVSHSDCVQAVLICCLLAAIATLIIARSGDHGEFLLRLFLVALLVRMVVATAIFIFNGQAFFGGDAFTYDNFAYLLMKGWHGDEYAQLLAEAYVNKAGTGWGMIYLVAGIYNLIGRNMLATQYVNAVLGAATVPLIYLSAWAVFANHRVARMSGFAVAFMPSLVLWSAQGLKDGPIMFFLAMAILATLKLGQKFTVKYFLALVATLGCILAFRFYIFYMLVPAIVGSLVIGSRALSQQGLVRQFVMLMVLIVVMTFFGAIMGARKHFEIYGSLRQVQVNRLDAAQSAKSGFGRDVDVSTTGGAVSAIPVGLVYLLLAPFPWQLGSLRQAITMPEMIVWWSSLPMLILGCWFSIRYRFRQALPILVFTFMLTLAYSVFQGNVGNAYRQRAQLLIFYSIFVCVGYKLMLEKRAARSSDRELLSQLRDTP